MLFKTNCLVVYKALDAQFEAECLKKYDFFLSRGILEFKLFDLDQICSLNETSRFNLTFRSSLLC